MKITEYPGMVPAGSRDTNVFLTHDFPTVQYFSFPQSNHLKVKFYV